MSAWLYSGASASRGASKARCALRVRFSAESRTEITVGEPESRSPPASANAPPPATSRNSISRRLSEALRFMGFLLDAVAPGDHRNHVVDDPGDQHHRQMHDEKADEIGGQQEMNRARRLPAAEQFEQ